MASGCNRGRMASDGTGRLLAILVLAFVGLTSTAHAERYIRELPPAGGRGDYAFNDVCKNGFLIGFRAHMGAWMDNIEMICSTYEPGQPWNPRMVEGRGGDGGSTKYNTGQCDNGRVLSGITLKFTKDFRQVFGIYGRCRDIATGKNSPAFAILPFDQQQAETESATKTYTCGSNEAAAGISGRYGKHVNAIGLNCGRFPPEDAAPPPQAATPPKPIKTTGKAKGAPAGPSSPPGVLVCRTGVAMQPIGAPQADGGMVVSFAAAPQPADQALPDMGQCAWDTQTISPNQAKRLALRASVMARLGDIHIDRVFRIHATAMTAFLFSTGDVEILVDNAPGAGGASVDPGKGAGIVAGASASFAGEWNATADGVAYDIIINKQGGAMVGTFTGADGSSGQLSGAPRGNVLRFSWSQADGSRGTGRFVLSANGSSFTGSYNFGGNRDVAEGSWNGTRVAQ